MNRLILICVILAFPLTLDGYKNFKYGGNNFCGSNLSDDAKEQIWKCILTYYEPLYAFYDCIEEEGFESLKDYLDSFCSNSLSHKFHQCLKEKGITDHEWMPCREKELYDFCLKNYEDEEEEK